MLGMNKEFAMRTAMVAGLLATVAIAVGCGAPKEISIDASYNGRQVELQKGQTVVITLESNASTGYSWQLGQFPAGLLRQLGVPQYKPGSTELLGAPGTETFRFQAVNPGQGTLSLIYVRSWEEGVSPQAEFAIQVTVR